MLYNTIEKNPIFGKLNNVDLSLKDVFETEVERKDNENALKHFEFDNENGNFYHLIYLFLAFIYFI